jgi:hypothetical protein
MTFSLIVSDPCKILKLLGVLCGELGCVLRDSVVRVRVGVGSNILSTKDNTFCIIQRQISSFIGLVIPSKVI